MSSDIRGAFAGCSVFCHDLSGLRRYAWLKGMAWRRQGDPRKPLTQE
ncbi:hypothetical protein DVU_2249 [Nitratidesulfovibrio vulgaris str. Hildenborough]|uniref:Uncharacterized protein n=1 Tax=Nitratidesulfovibrio vulgaris (strain ATCC 29579 / DSM 644 / CCUG 34227 / NCIMB 8303 / VKM B-1760 / Hildenborough) TaxID=882 RepID=Q729U9_NITV2|nr:hypothetical protein DVU_2249 [Nitratidesulfovibrio vulgaris str. Hildenborough]